MGFCNRMCCLYACTLISAVFVVLSGLTYTLINPIVLTVLTSEFVISSPEAVRYTDWQCKFSILTTGFCAPEHDSVPFYESYYLLNLTNYEQVLQGATPQYIEVGPYKYQVSITKFNVDFRNDNDTVAYIEATTYYWSDDSCEGCTPEDVFIGINTGYLGAVQTASSETLLLLGLSGPSIDRILKDIRTYYIDQYLIQGGRQTSDAILATCVAIDAACASLDDAAIVQWYYRQSLTFIGLYNDAVNEVLPAVFPDPAEWSANANVGWSINITRTLLYGPYGIVPDPLNLLDLATLVASGGNDEEIMEKWGITTAQFLAFGTYIGFETGGGIRTTYTYRLMESVIGLNQGGGLFSARTMYQWVFYFEDPLLLLLQPSDPQTAIRHNDTSFEDAASYKVGVEILTGKNDTSLIAEVIMWNGTDTVYYWMEPYPVSGNNQDGQFIFQIPDNKGKQADEFAPFPVWSPDHARTVNLVDTGVWVDTPQGIPTRRFYLANETYDIDPFFYQSYKGFVNASVFHSDPPFRQRFVFSAIIPLYLSQPRFFDADPYYASKIEFLNVQPNFDQCATIVDVEPISGNAMYAKKRVQVNFLVTNETSFNLFYPNIPMNMFYPSLWVEQSSEITEALADEWLSLLGLGLTIEEVLFIAGLTVSSFAFVLCIICIARSRREPAPIYEKIND